MPASEGASPSLGPGKHNIELRCSHCGAIEAVDIPLHLPHNALGCRFCHIGIVKGRRQTWEVQGVDGTEVAKVVEAIWRAERDLDPKSVVLNLSNSTVGLLSTDVAILGAIEVNASHIAKAGNDGVADSIQNLTHAILDEASLASSDRSELLEALEELSNQAAVAPETRAKRGVLKSLVATIGQTLQATGGLAAAWTAWGPDILKYFGLA